MIAIRSVEVITNRDDARGAVTLSSGATVREVMVSCRGWRARIELHDERDGALVATQLAAGTLTLIVGDIGEARAGPPPYVNAMRLELATAAATLTASVSLTGLPPLFVLAGDRQVSVSSPCPPRAGARLSADLDGVADTLRWGHPIDGRTLFAELSVEAAGASLVIDADGSLTRKPPLPWPPIAEFAGLTREELVQQQLQVFARAAQRIDASSAFMSLSGGLDSRTALAGLLSHGQRPKCVTLAATPLNLDARLATEVCRAFGLEHETVLLDAQFERALPDLVSKTAGLTGGVSCLSQSADLYLYGQLTGAFSARISGNLGNQVGRGGVESLSAYRPAQQIFSAPVQARLRARPLAPWFIERLAAGDYGAVLFGQEVHYWSIPNYVVGSSRALQLTPYADRQLLYLARAGFARDPALASPTWQELRRRDLRHRLSGIPRSRSFQREFLARQRPGAGRVPLNWGWYAAGGASLTGRVRAAASAADAAMAKLSARPGLARPLARWLGARLGNRSALVNWPLVLRTRLRELAQDTFRNMQVREAGLFELTALDRMVNEHFSGAADHHSTVARALEIALGMATSGGQRAGRADHD